MSVYYSPLTQEDFTGPKSLFLYASEYVCNHMHWDGQLNATMKASGKWWDAYCMFDGFGKKTREWHDEYGFDWSHVRDSSEETIIQVARWIKDNVYAPSERCMTLEDEIEFIIMANGW